MNISLVFLRLIFALLSIIFFTLFMVSTPAGMTGKNFFLGLGFGALFSLLLISFDALFRRFSLRSFNLALFGCFFGFLMGKALVLIFQAILEITNIGIALQPQTIDLIKICLFLFSTYLATMLTLRSADEIYVSIPFVKFTPKAHKKKDLLLDFSVLADARIIDAAATGILDHQLIIPRFILKDLYTQSETGDEMNKSKARRALDVVKKLEAIPNLNLRFNDTNFTEVKDHFSKMIRLARLIDADIFTADMSKIQSSIIEGVNIINIHTLSNALKPLMQTGELLKIKIQRYGKEPRQGVGYLEDGTMVVVNGGGDFIGETIDAHVLSVKHTSSGRIIFCNAMEEMMSAQTPHYDLEHSHE